MEAFHYFAVRVPPLQELSQNATLDATPSTVQDLFWSLTLDSLGCNRYHNVLPLTIPMGTTKAKNFTQFCPMSETALCKDEEIS